MPLVDASLDPAAPWLAYRLITDARTLSEAMESLPLELWRNWSPPLPKESSSATGRIGDDY